MAQLKLNPQDTDTFKLAGTLQAASSGNSEAIRHLSGVQPETICARSRVQWMQAMRNLLRTNNTCSQMVMDKIIAVCRFLGDWSLLIQIQSKGSLFPANHELVTPYIQLGRWKEAQHLLQQHSDTALSSTHAQQAGYVEAALQIPGISYAEASKSQLYLTPMDFHHVSDFCWQYADPDIASLCNLPVFRSAEHWINWLYYCKQNPHQQLFAIIHREWGFIGSANLHVHDGHGFFYYWLGSDFRGQGYGPAAVQQLLQLGKDHFAMQDCFTKVFKHNRISQQATQKAGFARLPFKAVLPEDNEVFYYQGKDCAVPELYAHLTALLVSLGSEIQLAPLV
ncbi:GNAT family N-acetyltransferase [Planctobacterium marinum]|uniref:GNAT family N-acetyltransferase n=1 Tax=Planctobacterium marinum TaxID=1631968 RepID=UPI001E3EEDEA|nr:GNAT family N-acetyltransferase [Planctobacterium marinum]MCC2605114.1 GNAT family N-acetyltransferase [Planctobacterium marinum]